MKYIFLDIDGVLNSGTNPELEDDKVKILSEIVKETNAEIILISSWKEDWNKTGKYFSSQAKSLDDTMKRYEIKITDKTETNRERGEGIERFLEKYPAEKWIILDDEFFPDYKNLKEHLVQTNFSKGITNEDKKESIKKLL